MKQASTIFVLLFAATAAAAPVHDEAAARQRYGACLDRTHSNPGAALADAEAWIKSGGGVPASHCAALALVGLKRYGEAGVRLDELARSSGVKGGRMRSELLDQAGNAWMLAGKPGAAETSFSQALAISSSDPDLFSDLARAHAMEKDWKSAEADLNAALALSPGRPDLMVLRASARHAQGRKVLARADLDEVLRKFPGYAPALLERGEMKIEAGDIKGARTDWQDAVASDPHSSAGETARSRLDAMDGANVLK